MTTLEQIAKIQKDYDLQSNVPTNHPYWDLLNKFRGGVNNAPQAQFSLAPLNQAPPKPELYESTKHSILRVKISVILLSYEGKEPNIPYTHEYWFLQNQLRHLDRLEAAQ